MNLEIAVIRCLIELPYLLDDSDLKKDMFLNLHLQKIFSRIVELRESGIKGTITHVDLEPLKGKIQDKLLIAVLSESVALSEFKRYEDELIQAYIWREAKHIQQEANERLSSGSISSIEAVGEIMDHLSQIESRSSKRKIECIEDWVRHHRTIMEERINRGGDLAGLSSGFKKLDQVLSGLNPGVITIAARPGVGKTAILMNIAMRVARSSPVLYISLECPKVEFVDRETSMESGIDSRLIQAGLISEKDYDRYHAAQKRIENLSLFLYENSGATIQEVRAISRRAVRDNGVKLIVIDYTQLINVPGITDKTQQVRAVSDSLRQIAVEIDVPIVTAAQLGRASEDNVPSLRHLEHSSSIEQNSHVVILLEQEDDDAINPKILFHIRKNRNGQTGTIPFYCHRPTLTFKEAI